jgi:hypothetical protein
MTAEHAKTGGTCASPMASLRTAWHRGRLELPGTFCRDSVLEEGSSIHLYGAVSGDVHNRGGELLVHGSIGGALHRESGTTVIDPDAAIAVMPSRSSVIPSGAPDL